MLNRIFEISGRIGKYHNWLLIGILLLSGILRGVMVFTVSDENFYHNDGAEYMDISRNLAKGRGFSLSYYRWHEPERPGFRKNVDVHTDLARTPLLPLLGAGICLLTEHVTFWAKIVSLLLSVLAVYCVYLLGREVHSGLCGLWSSFIFAFYPYSIYYAASWSTETLFLITLCLTFVFFLRALHGRYGSLGWCALFLALGALTRPTAILLLPVLCCCLYVRFGLMGSGDIFPLRKWSFPWKLPLPLVKHTGVFLLVFFLAMLPWTVRNRVEGGSWNMTTFYDGYVFFLSFSEIFMVTYETMDTKDYTEKTRHAWEKVHGHYIRELHRKKIYDFPAVSRQWFLWGKEQIRKHPERVCYLLKERFLHYWRMCPNLIVLTPLQIVMLRIFFSCIFFAAVTGFVLKCSLYDTWILLLPVVFGLVISVPFLFVLRYRYPFFAPYICVLGALPLAEWRRFFKNAPKKTQENLPDV